jgi:hypothetical protein
VPKFGVLWLSGTYKGENLEPTSVYGGQQRNARLTAKSDAEKVLGFGQRIHVLYLTGETLAITGVVEDRTVCSDTPRICQVFDFVRDHEIKLTDGMPVLNISFELTK